MSTPIGSSQWMYSSGVEFSIDQSLRFNDADDHYLNRVASTGDSQKWTWSGWVKRGNLGTLQAIFSEGTSASSFALYFNTTDTLYAQERNSSSNRFLHATDAVFRDVAAWYHIVYAVDTTQATDSDRVNLYVNGQIQTLAAVSGSIYPSLNLPTNMNVSGRNHSTGYAATNSFKCLDGYLAEVNFVDSEQLDATDFGETINGIWVPKAYSGSYGVNGYYLTFSSDSFTDNASDPDVFADQAGSNNHNAYNFKASDIVLDSPSLNYPTWNPLVNTGQTLTFAEGNLNLDASSTFWSSGTWNQSTMGVLGGSDAKYYFEFTMNGNTSGSYVIGVGRQNSSAIDTTHYTGGVVYYNNRCSSDATNTVTGLTIASSLTIIRLAFDASNGKVWIGNNTGWFNSGDPAAGTGEVGTISGYDGEMLVAILNRSTNAGDQVVNFGQDDTFAGFKTSGSASATDDNGYGTFYYTPPTSFLALNSASLPEPTIAQPSDYFNSVLYTGDGTSSNAITAGLQPDWTWIKTRNGTASHALFDSVRGADNVLRTNGTDGENASGISTASFGGLTSFDSDGFTVDDGTDGTFDATNGSGDTYVSWNWKAGGSSNTFNIDGTGYATASAAGLTGGNIAADAASISKTAGISILKYTGDGSSSPYSTIKHGLDSPPEFYICKSLDTNNADNWVFFHTIVDGTHDFMYLNLNNGNNNSAINFPPTNTTVKVGGNAANENNKNFLMIAMHSVQGFSKFGTYVGNGSSTGDGTYVNVGFKPAFVMVKRTNSTGNWTIWDATRNEYNVTNNYLFANEGDLDVAGTGNSIGIDILSNGWKFRSNASNWNTSGSTYSYLSFAEMDFKKATAR